MIIITIDLTQEEISEFCGLLYHYGILYIKHKDYVEIYLADDVEEKVMFLYKKIKQEN